MEPNRVAMIGCGSMGGNMALRIAETGIAVALHDPKQEAMDSVIERAKKDALDTLVSKHADYKSLSDKLGAEKPKVFFWSLPHGDVGDKVLSSLMPHLRKGDVIIDCANEHWENTERRQGKCVTRGIRYVGCGVSGGYQAARRGPSMCPGADDETLALVLPILRRIAAKDPQGNPCVGAVGTGGAGHYCKMIHNGIEHGMMSAICEAWGIMTQGLGMSLDMVADEFNKWDEKGELRGTFLIKIGADICRTRDPETGERVLSTVEDKVVQDFTGEEGTGIWSNTEAVEQHTPAPTMSTAHFLRLASGERRQRIAIRQAFGLKVPSPQKKDRSEDQVGYLKLLQEAVFVTCLAAYCQGLNVIHNADRQKQFNINYADLMQVWRAGCIIQADYVSETLLQPFYNAHRHVNADLNPLRDPNIAEHLRQGYPALRRICEEAVRHDWVIPSLSATLEYLKIQTNTALPTSFYEAQLDYFGAHMYDKKGEDPKGLPIEGKYHFEWKPA